MTTYAIVEASGKQFWVEPGRFYDLDRMGLEPDSSLVFDKVLLIQHNGETHVGQPYVEGATIDATVMSHLRGRKILVYKMRPKKKTRKRQGHRQDLTRVMIESIAVNGSALARNQGSDDLPVSEAEVD
ncbi:50S ribosomal protein L21 [Prochlorothrix hollandica]|uniref:Large ribosomal subunit protein bL21 n=1 Tax=Prochlorothrix hollandica PCC 9006 = CALU 1027 TaxID=317619 RepID=A0A0M2PYK8_PROHO|nr:50S ribosomal protein L21 [Prochlorothrix hollandica]KKI99466.1 50S ribosomal protein L21 [Prochlorothrix hollandica PCC 9006 = CALU 1027]KKJ01419.1 50S ribosomal protein L21 [Prochlorothrix hollandica PCC 9006 = CALU 1027]